MGELKENDVLEALKNVQDPDLHKDIVNLGFVKNIKISPDDIHFDIELTTPACPMKKVLEEGAREAVAKIAGSRKIEIRMTSRGRMPHGAPEKKILEGVKNVIAIASGKGGVGKSTVSANLALALHLSGAKVGLLDADLFGPSLPGMFGIASKEPRFEADGKIIPNEAYGIQLMSMGFLVQPDAALIWRGPMVTKMIEGFLSNVVWGELDYLILDLPPGTGDIQLTLAQTAPLTGAVIVSTPQDVALSIAKKGLFLFQQVNVPVLGFIENMSTFICPHCGKRTEIFGHGGVTQACKSLGIPFLGEIPLDPAIVMTGDRGKPIILEQKGSPIAQAYQDAAGKMVRQISIVNEETEKATVIPVEIKAGKESQSVIIQ